jgi:hypothetical protein
MLHALCAHDEKAGETTYADFRNEVLVKFGELSTENSDTSVPGNVPADEIVKIQAGDGMVVTYFGLGMGQGKQRTSGNQHCRRRKESP